MLVERTDLIHLQIPLKTPYVLSFGPVDCLNTVLCRIALNNGAVGWGECTPLQGYSDASVEDIWKRCSEMCREYVGQPLRTVLEASAESVDGFYNTAVCTALEEVAGEVCRTDVDVPLAVLLQESQDKSFPVIVEGYRKRGFQTFKLKVGYKSLEDDISRVEAVQSSLMPGEWLRIDANQAWSGEEALRFSRVLHPAVVQLLEQPLPVDDWEALYKLGRESVVPLMLDESIQDTLSIQRAAQIPGVRYVKLKWMKQGSWKGLKDHARAAMDIGLQVILGNGVATGLNNYHEALFWQAHLSDMNLAGEMTGFMKTSGDIMSGEITCKDGRLRASCMDDRLPDLNRHDHFVREVRHQSLLNE